MINILEHSHNDSTISEQFSRGRRSTRFSFCNMAVIGLGGIGSHVASVIGSLGNVKNLILIDSDNVELTNLNRSNYKYDDIGISKVESISQDISSRNFNINLIPINKDFNEELCTEIINENKLFQEEYMFIDCRDNFYGDYHLIKSLNEYNMIVRAAYNGMNVTIDLNPEIHPVWGQGGYTETVSHSIPARLSAILIVNAIINYNYYKEQFPEMFNKPIVFDSMRIIDMLSFSQRIMTLDPELKSDLIMLLDCKHPIFYER